VTADHPPVTIDQRQLVLATGCFVAVAAGHEQPLAGNQARCLKAGVRELY